MTPRERSIADLLRESPMTLHELAYRLGLRQNYVRLRMDGLRARGLVRPLRRLRQSRISGFGCYVWGLV